MRRVVFLVDMNAFFISCETTRKPELSGVPAAVAGDPAYRAGIILAANYEARRFGVRTTMVVREASRICPELRLIAPDHAFYEQKSQEVMALLGTFSPLVEPNSIDEAWLDMTGAEGLFGEPLQAAKTIMARIRDELGLWCSIGIAENKYLAKMAADMKKPMGITELWPEQVPAKLWPLPVGDLLGVGKKSVERLNRHGIFRIGDLARLDPQQLGRLFGRGGYDLWRHANGQDGDPVTPPVQDSMKSIGRSTTLPHDMREMDQAWPVLMRLTDDVMATLRRHGKQARVVQIALKYADFSSVTRQSAIAATHDTAQVQRVVRQLLSANWDPDKPVRLLGISVSGFEQADQISLFDLPVPERDSGQAAIADASPRGGVHASALDETLDRLRARFGEDAVQRARLLGEDKPRRHGGPTHKND